MPRAIESIQTRQRAEPLFGSSTPLAAGASVVLPNPTDGSLVAGFNAVLLFAISDQPFVVRIFEGCREGGTFAVTETLTSVPSGPNQTLCARILPCGRKLRAVLQNTGAAPQTFLSFCGSGLPEP